ASRVRVEAIDITGPRLVADRAEDATISALGVRTTTRPARLAAQAAKKKWQAMQAETPVVAPPQSVATSASPPPRIELGRLTWKSVDVLLHDHAVVPPTDIRIDKAGVELADIVIDFDPATKGTGKPGRVRASLAANGVASEFNVDGFVTSSGVGPTRAMTADLNINGKGLRGEILAPYLRAAGMEPMLKDGSLNLRTKLSLARKPADPKTGVGVAIAASFAVEDLRYADGGQELLGVKVFKVDDATLTRDGLSVAAVTLAEPRARAERNADGSLLAAGVRMNIPSTQPAVSDATPPTTPPTTSPAPLAEAKSPGPALATQPATPAPPVRPFVATLGQ